MSCSVTHSHPLLGARKRPDHTLIQGPAARIGPGRSLCKTRTLLTAYDLADRVGPTAPRSDQ